MARSTIGLDIGTTAVRAAELKPGDPPTLVRFAQVALPPGAMVNGEIAEPATVTDVIKDLWRRGDFKGKRVGIAVANQNVIVRPVELPRMEEEELRSALAFQVQDSIPIPIEDAHLDHIPLEEFLGEEDAPMMRVLVVAAQRGMIETFVSTVTEAGLEPVGIDVGPLATMRAVLDPTPSIVAEREADAIIDIGGGLTDVVVHERGTPRMVRILLEGGDDLTNALATELNLEREDAERQKIEIGLQPEGTAVDKGAPSILEQRARSFIDDVRRSLEYYRTQPDAMPVARAWLTGGGSRLPRLAERLAVALQVPVEPAPALAHLAIGNIGLSEEQLAQVSVVAATAVGLALEDR